jgi:hypothetical protein
MEDVAQQAQLDEPERRHLEKIVKQLRERAEETVEYWVHSKLNLAEEGAEAPANLSAEEQELRGRVEEAIEREQAGERSWAKARDLYVKGVGYTLVNRLAALRCMEVRGFLDRSPTRFRDDGVTPAADRLITDYFLPREAGIWTAFLVACQERSEEIEILFDLSDPYSLLYGDLTDWDGEPEEVAWSDDLQSSLVDLLQDLGGLLDEVDDSVWRADDVLGWVYEYYNVPDLEGVRSSVKTKEDTIAANQFYTPHWVVRMLVDNSLGKLYLEHDGSLEEAVAHQEKRFTPEERKDRAPSMDESPSVADLCSYLVPTEEEGEPTDTLDEEGPKGLRVFDPASGSAHFLLYAFDVLERIWRAETDVDHGKIPEKILEHNLYGVDLDLRACQLAAFNLYLKARTRAEEEGNENFQMPDLGIVCADAHVADLDRSHVVFDEVAGDDDDLRDALDSILNSFEHVEGLGSLLDVKGTLADLIEENSGQLDAFRDDDAVTLPQLLERLHNAVDDHVEGESFRAKDLRSFLRLLVILSQDYDVTLMNPPYGSSKSGRMPKEISNYVSSNYRYHSQYYMNMVEVADSLCKKEGRCGALIPRTFMYNNRCSRFREDFTGDRGSFGVLAEFGLGVLDNATVRTAGCIIKFRNQGDSKSVFFRLYDVESGNKERKYIQGAYSSIGEVKRKFKLKNSSFRKVDGSPITYWTPEKLRNMYKKYEKLESKNSNRKAITGIRTSNNERFLSKHWEHSRYKGKRHYAKGGASAWILPELKFVVQWGERGEEVLRSGKAMIPYRSFFGKAGLTWTYIKATGRRFGVFPPGGLFATTGPMLFTGETSTWTTMSILNSIIYHGLFLARTSKRHWQVGDVRVLPWPKKSSRDDRLEEKAKNQYQLKLSTRIHNHRSPLFVGVAGMPKSFYESYVYSNHPVRKNISVEKDEFSLPPEKTIHDRFKNWRDFKHKVRNKVEDEYEEIDSIIAENENIDKSAIGRIEEEIKLRNQQGNKRQILSKKKYTKKVILDVVRKIVGEDDDGIVLLRTESDEEEADLLAKMTAKFEEIWGEYAEDRLQEVDEVLGDREPTDEPYPNLRHWLENDLFAFHCDEFENTPILWELTTERLGDEDNEDAGFACLIDYHQLGPDVFDRLSARYLETRKAALRERQQSARRTAEGSEGTQAREARQEEKRCENALRQIDELETRISELTQTQPRDWADAVRDEARDLKPKVRRFRERLEERLETLDALHEEAPSAWFKDHFSDKFMESVNGNRGEWIDALEDLEAACEQFARPADQPVEAHLYDLLPYFDDLTGSTHYSSNGIFFLNYYFSKGKDLAAKIDQGNKDRVTRREQLVADLARETDKDIELGEEINEACQEMKKHMDSDWKPRALEEVRTPGYRPVKKHGVAINITPLAEKKLVPELVDKKVL